MLSRKVAQVGSTALARYQAAPFRPVALRVVTQHRCKSDSATPAKDAPSALQNLKIPASSSPSKKGLPPRPDDNEERDSAFRTWALAANKIASFAIIPSVLVYAVFWADWGDHEHVFMPARRWLLRQKAAFYTLTPAEQELIKPKEMTKVVRLRDLQKGSEPRNSTDSPSSSPTAS